MRTTGEHSGKRGLTACVALALTTMLLPALAASLSAQTYSVIYDFCSKGGGDCTDGANPYTTNLVLDKAGNLYGGTSAGGGVTSEAGIVFKLTPTTSGNWTESVLHTFDRLDGYDLAGLFLSGNALFGFTQAGGAYDFGVIFELNIVNNQFKLLYSFTGGADGGQPVGAPVVSNGILYGTTFKGGSSGFGTVFMLDLGTRAETVLHSFSNSDGANPYSTLILSPNIAGGTLWGTTEAGGSTGSGVLFKYSITNSTYEALYNFALSPDGSAPCGTMALDKLANLYGATKNGGLIGDGTVFELDASDAETVLYNFTGQAGGGFPNGGVLHSTDGHLYGTTIDGGSNSDGTVFELANPNGNWQETVLHSFGTFGDDGQRPYSGVIMDSKGDLFGTTSEGGTNVAGTVWEITPI
jgi:uncharacterized repeat protein (TIGR03803 family)